MMKKTILLILTMIVSLWVTSSEASNKHADWPEVDQKALKDWQGLGFGMFIHWGPVSITGHEIGWSRGDQTPIEEYDNLYRKFNPESFNAEEWVLTARQAGMKYLVITTKHHDGFCLWPSAVTDYDIGETPFKRDVLAELSKACKKYSIKFGTYYSSCDWHHPSYPLGSPHGRSKKPNPDLDAYDKYLRAQTTELIKNYGPLLTIWFDVPQVYGPKHGVDMVRKLRELQPDILINNRAYSGCLGDYVTPEQHIGGFDRDRPWETCMTICQQWAWKPNDNMKSLKECIQTLLYTVGGDGNLLFNVGPMSDGRIEPRQVKRLKEMGEWLTDYKNGVYKTRGGPFMPGKWGASTCRDKSIYLFVMRWNDNSLLLPPIDFKITEATALSGGKVEVVQNDDGITLTMSKENQKEIATVIELKMDGDAMSIEPMKLRRRPNSLSFGKKATASNVFQNMHAQYGPDMALDNNSDTRWATDSGTKAASFEIDLGKITEIKSITIDEASWNRVRAFEVQYKTNNDDWKTIFSGTTIGDFYRKTFPPIKTQLVRLKITDATEGPTIEEIELH